MIRWTTTDPLIRVTWSDRELLDGYELTSGETEDEEAKAMLAEIQRQGLEV